MAHGFTLAAAAIAPYIAGFAAPDRAYAKGSIELSDGTVLTLPDADSLMDCSEMNGASEGAKYTCIQPGSPGLMERVKSALSENGYIPYDDLRLWSEFCNAANAATVSWVTDGLSDYASRAEKRAFFETAPVVITISSSNCDEILVQDSRIANELGLIFDGRVRVRDTYRDDEAQRWVYGYSESTNRRGIAFFPEFGQELQSFNKLHEQLVRLGFVSKETNPQLGGQGFCKNESDAIFLTSHEDDAYYFRQFDYVTDEFRAGDPRLGPLLIQYFPDSGCEMFYG